MHLHGFSLPIHILLAWTSTVHESSVLLTSTLLITDDRIAGVWPAGQQYSVPEEAEVIDATGKIITPGFINTHRHGWQTIFKTLMSNTTIVKFSSRFGEFAVAVLLSPEQVFVSQLTGLYEALNAGVTATIDHAHNTWSDDTSYAGLNASITSGAWVFWAYTFHNVTNYTVSEQLLNFRSIAEAALFENTAVSPGVACNFFGGGDAVLEDVNAGFDLAKEFKVSVITTHALEAHTAASSKLKNPIRERLGHPRQEPKLAELPWDAQYQYPSRLRACLVPDGRGNRPFTCHEPVHLHHARVRNANGHGTPQSAFMMGQGALGMDSRGFFSTDMVTQARIWLQSTRLKLYDHVLDTWRIPATMSVVQAFLMTTRKGGLALRRPDLGVLRVGAKADVVFFDGTSPSLLRWIDPVASQR
ncbi:hypothetical protein ACJZ2D_003407 [Fusarium nematophilum]